MNDRIVRLDPTLEALLDGAQIAQVVVWLTRDNRRLDILRELTGGLSGAHVFLVTLDSESAPAQKLVMKFVPGEDALGEQESHLAALRSSETFAKDHLASIAVEGLRFADGSELLFQSIAGWSTQSVKALSSLSGTRDQSTLIPAVLGRLITQWNVAWSVHSMSIAEYLRTAVRKKLGPDGSLTTWLVESFTPQALESPWISFNGEEQGQELPNHYLFAIGDFAQIELSAICGNSHLDLHAENLLVKMGRVVSPEDFYIIDLSYYDPRAPLAHDQASLLLSEIQLVLHNWDMKRRRVAMELMVGSYSDHVPADLASFADLLEQWRRVPGKPMVDRGFADDWDLQLDVSVVGTCLVWASRPRLELDDRVWFLELAARMCAKILRTTPNPIRVPPPQTPLQIGLGRSTGEVEAQAAADFVSEFTSEFSTGVTSVAIVAPGSLTPDSARELLRSRWSLIICLDPDESVQKVVSSALATEPSIRLIRPGQDFRPTRAFTSWFAIADDRSTALSTREWRADYLPLAKQAIQNLGERFATPVAVVVFGSLDLRGVGVVESAIDVLGSRVGLLEVSTSEPKLGPYDATSIWAEPDGLVKFLPTRDLLVDEELRQSVPGLHGPVQITSRDLAWLEEADAELIHSKVSMHSDSAGGHGAGYFRGRRITWFELEAGVDIERPPFQSQVVAELEALLSRRNTHRFNLRHRPGSGGTTLARRIAWGLSSTHPTLVFTRPASAKSVADRVQRLAQISDAVVLVILDGVPERVSDAIYDQLKSNSVPATLVLVGRRSGKDGISDPKTLGLLDEDERGRFAKVFAGLAPLRRKALEDLASLESPMAVPFFFALTAFRDEYTGLRDYVTRSVEDAPPEIKKLLLVLALCERFAGIPVPGNLFAPFLNLPMDKPLRLTAHLSERVEGILVEEPIGHWRIAHPLIAEELLRQGSGSSSGLVQDWQTSLSSICVDLFDMIADAYPLDIPRVMDELLSRLFILRDEQEDVLTGRRARFAELVEAIPSLPARILVFTRLTETFPDEAHYLAHFARLLSYAAEDHRLARSAIESAILLAPEDPLLWNIHGLVVRNELYTLIAPSRAIWPPALETESQVQDLARESLGYFQKATELNSSDTYAYVGIIRLCTRVIEWGKRKAGSDSFAQFLKKSESRFYSELLDEAEEALERAQLVEGEDSSRFVDQADADLREMYDDFPAVLEGWRNLLQRPDAPSIPTRLRLVRAYERRAGGSLELRGADSAKALELLNENLADNYRHPPTIRKWLSVARGSGASLDRAAELASVWAEADPTRDSRFYDYVLTAVLALNGRGAALRDFQRKVEISRQSSLYFPRRRTPHEWLGVGDDFSALVHNSALEGWQRRVGGPDPSRLRRVAGSIKSIRNSAAGQLTMDGGIDAHFVPSVGGFLPDRDENLEVTALIAFTYEGPEAWSVALR